VIKEAGRFILIFTWLLKGLGYALKDRLSLLLFEESSATPITPPSPPSKQS